MVNHCCVIAIQLEGVSGCMCTGISQAPGEVAVAAHTAEAGALGNTEQLASRAVGSAAVHRDRDRDQAEQKCPPAAMLMVVLSAECGYEAKEDWQLVVVVAMRCYPC